MKLSLIDHFNAFHVRSQEVGLSPNARSLYFAILGEFNKLQYPPHIKLQNTYLQHLSGINSTCSFRSAINALVNSGLISCQKQVYTLETFQKDFRNSSERVSKDSFDSIPMSESIEKEKEKEREITTTTATTRAREVLGTNSEEVKQAWFLSEGEALKGGNAFDMIQLENAYGTEALVNAITAARRANTQPRLTYNFLKAVLERQQKGGKENARAGSRPVAEDWENQPPDWLG